MKRIIICADDYGQNSAISQAIVKLLENNRLSATSCLVTSLEWPTGAIALNPFKNKAHIGLHFNLTEGKPSSTALQSFWPLNQLILKSQLRLINKSTITSELHAQLDRFIKEMGTYPNFIDGHQHVHQFPVIRDTLLEVYEERLREHKVYLRCTYSPGSLFNFTKTAYLKNLIINLCGGIAFKKKLVEKNIPHNTTFSGIYNFKNANTYEKLFPQFLNESNDGGLIMCHPGLPSFDATDVIALARVSEYNYLLSEDYLNKLKQRKIHINQDVALTPS
ncbi:MAG: ChbG/HpnK family deacetylase [Gammaproteobacteria bacterium]|nr:ChbG/HpnK family deacetylase [Gammaproteobacteria bacterium]